MCSLLQCQFIQPTLEIQTIKEKGLTDRKEENVSLFQIEEKDRRELKNLTTLNSKMKFKVDNICLLKHKTRHNRARV